MKSRYTNVDESIKAINKCKNPIIGNIDVSDILDYNDGVQIAINKLLEMPVADVAEVKYGEWQITDAYPHIVYCSECHTSFAQTHWAVWEDGSLPRNFCPHCGANMKERKESQ